jgi:hypothetical protein
MIEIPACDIGKVYEEEQKQTFVLHLSKALNGRKRFEFSYKIKTQEEKISLVEDKDGKDSF